MWVVVASAPEHWMRWEASPQDPHHQRAAWLMTLRKMVYWFLVFLFKRAPPMPPTRKFDQIFDQNRSFWSFWAISGRREPSRSTGYRKLIIGMTSKVKNHFSGLDFDMISWFLSGLGHDHVHGHWPWPWPSPWSWPWPLPWPCPWPWPLPWPRPLPRPRLAPRPRPVPGVGWRKIFFGILTLKNDMLKIRKTIFLLTPDSFGTHPPPTWELL